jgi:pimeloyl-ACP methyl ester carboxylesterase
MKTLGGRQFWGDVRFFRGWRIQQNVFTGHFRLLDPGDNRKVFGSLEKCLAALETVKQREKLPGMSGKAAILIHGITRSSKGFARMRRALEKSGYLAVGFDYPSTRISIQAAAGYLAQVLESLDGIDEIHVIAHSMGGLVTRALLTERKEPRLKRIVMMGVPNRGAQMANLLRRNAAFRAVFGPAGQELVTDVEGTIPKLATPSCEFAIIAGGRGSARGYNPLIPGDDDMIVTVDSARLPGASDFLMVRALHTMIFAHAEVIAATVRFLQTGRLRETGEPQPIPYDEPAKK